MSHAGPPQPAPSVSTPARHPQAQTALILGIIALGGTFTCLLPIFMGPFAWYFGAKVKREIAAAPARWSGGSDAGAGMILGIVCTGLLAFLLLALLLMALGVAFLTHSNSYY